MTVLRGRSEIKRIYCIVLYCIVIIFYCIYILPSFLREKFMGPNKYKIRSKQANESGFLLPLL